jgi:hypothetical protein
MALPCYYGVDGPACRDGTVYWERVETGVTRPCAALEQGGGIPPAR